MYMVMLVLEDRTRLDEILYVWERAGFSGITILKSEGAYRRLNLSQSPDQDGETGSVGAGALHNYTLFSVVKDREMAQRGLEAVEEVIGSLEYPDTGIFTAWPLDITRGIPGPFGASAAWQDVG